MTYRDNTKRFERAPNAAQARMLLNHLAETLPHAPITPVDVPLYLYGAGSLGQLAHGYCQEVGIPIAGNIDKNAHQRQAEDFWANKKILSPDEITPDIKTNSRLAICVVTQPWEDITAPLFEDGWRDVVPFYALCANFLDLHPLDNGWLSGPLSRTDVDGMGEVLDGLADDVSRAHLLQFAAWHGIQQEWIFAEAPINAQDRCFPPEILRLLHDQEFFMDLGAYHGLVSQRFLEIVDGVCRGVAAFEGDTANARHMARTFESLPQEWQTKLHAETLVVGRKSGIASFRSGLGYASRLVTDGGAFTEIKTIDEMGLSPTFMKIHLEGNELDAILGGLRTITLYRPIMALSVYHNRQGLWEIANTLSKTLSPLGYRQLFRLHGWQGTGAYLYLIPADRHQ